MMPLITLQCLAGHLFSVNKVALSGVHMQNKMTEVSV